MMTRKEKDELWRLVKENTRGIKELREAQRKTDEQIKELREAQRKTDEQIKELREAQRKTDEQIKELREAQRKTDEQLRKTDAKLRRLGEEIGKITDGWGKFVEGLVEPSVVKTAKKLGFKVRKVLRYVVANRGRTEAEFDIILDCEKAERRVLLVVEAKSTLRAEDVKKFEKNLNNFFEYFSEYKGSEVIGFVAGVRFGDGVAKYAERAGFFVLVPSGDVMKLLNRRGFKPKIFRV